MSEETKRLGTKPAPENSCPESGSTAPHGAEITDLHTKESLGELHPRAPGEAFDPARLEHNFGLLQQLGIAPDFDASAYERPARAANAGGSTAPAKPTGEAISGAGVRVAISVGRLELKPAVAERSSLRVSPHLYSASVAARLSKLFPEFDISLAPAARELLHPGAHRALIRGVHSLEPTVCPICGGRNSDLATAAGHHAPRWVWFQQYGSPARWALIDCAGAEVKS